MMPLSPFLDQMPESSGFSSPTTITSTSTSISTPTVNMQIKPTDAHLRRIPEDSLPPLYIHTYKHTQRKAGCPLSQAPYVCVPSGQQVQQQQQQSPIVHQGFFLFSISLSTFLPL
ncbi:hypothetical protein ACJQWK_09948 [Exserohilum turcicum]